MMSAKMVTSDLLEIKVFLNKIYGVIISAHDVTNKILSPDDEVTCPKFGNASTSMREVNITSVL